MARTAPRFFARLLSSGKKILLSPEESHHALTVRRLKAGDPVILFDGDGRAFDGVIQEKREKQALVEVREERKTALPSLPSADISVSPPQGKRMDFLVEKCSEMGVHRILPFRSSRSIRSEPGEEKLRRWRRIAMEASKQSGRRFVTHVERMTPLEEILKTRSAYNHAFLLHPAPQLPNPVEAFATIRSRENILLFVGPEGGFTDAEILDAEKEGVTPLSMPFPILRVETAAIFSLASLMSFFLRNEEKGAK